jgi:chromosome segregation ATPase
VLEEKRGLTITLDGQRGEINKLQDGLRARQKKIDDLKEEVDDLKEEMRDKDEEMDKLKGELDERLREAERLKGHVEEHSDKVEKLREELTIKTGELIERERADKTEVGKENLLQQKTTKLEKMVRDMHVELNVKKQSLKKAIKQSEQVGELPLSRRLPTKEELLCVWCVCGVDATERDGDPQAQR